MTDDSSDERDDCPDDFDTHRADIEEAQIPTEDYPGQYIDGPDEDEEATNGGS